MWGFCKKEESGIICGYLLCSRTVVLILSYTLELIEEHFKISSLSPHPSGFLLNRSWTETRNSILYDTQDFPPTNPAEVEKEVNLESAQISLSTLLCQHLPKHLLQTCALILGLRHTANSFSVTNMAMV